LNNGATNAFWSGSLALLVVVCFLAIVGPGSRLNFVALFWESFDSVISTTFVSLLLGFGSLNLCDIARIFGFGGAILFFCANSDCNFLFFCGVERYKFMVFLLNFNGLKL
jgi:hypothetical protein